MADPHEPQIPLALEMVLSRLSELAVVIGPQARPTLGAVQALLQAAIAARDAGETGAAIAKIGEAMDRLAGLADQLDADEAVLMRAVAQQFRSALLRGDRSRARESADVMFERSGAKIVKKE